MKNKFLSMLSIVAIFLTTLLISGCQLPEPLEKVQLSTPENLKVDEALVITWDEVENAENYVLYFYQEDSCIKSVDGNPGIIVDFLEPGIYQVAIRANGDLKKFSSSAFSNKITFEVTKKDPSTKVLPTPTNISASYDSVTKSLRVNFKDQEEYVNAASFQVYVYDQTVLIKTVSVESSGKAVGLVLGDGTYSIKVKAIAKNNEYANSLISTESASFTISTGGQGTETELTGYYKNANGLTGNELKSALTTIITTTHKHSTTYEELKTVLQDSDADLNRKGYVMTIYSRQSVKAQWDSGHTWNREHVWPNSKGVNKSGPGADAHHLRPEDPNVNSTRGSWKVGEVNGGKEIMFKGSVHTYCYVGNNTFEPCDAAKGDVARIYMYLLVRYPYLKDYFSQVGEMDVLLRWNELDPVDAQEIQRNEVVFKFQGNRNPFIDHPELAQQIW